VLPSAVSSRAKLLLTAEIERERAREGRRGRKYSRKVDESEKSWEK
jgi:hypothetical protein